MREILATVLSSSPSLAGEPEANSGGETPPAPPVATVPAAIRERQPATADGDVTSTETRNGADKRTRGADKRKRPLNDEARACINAFNRQRRSDPDVKMKPFCRDYAQERVLVP